MRAVVEDFEPGGGGFEGVGGFFTAVTQAVLLFGEETWVLNPRMERALSSFQHRVTRRLTRRQTRKRGGWELGIPLIGGGNGGSRLQGYWYILQKEAGYNFTVYCDATNYGPL